MKNGLLHGEDRQWSAANCTDAVLVRAMTWNESKLSGWLRMWGPVCTANPRYKMPDRPQTPKCVGKMRRVWDTTIDLNHRLIICEKADLFDIEGKRPNELALNRTPLYEGFFVDGLCSTDVPFKWWWTNGKLRKQVIYRHRSEGSHVISELAEKMKLNFDHFHATHEKWSICDKKTCQATQHRYLSFKQTESCNGRSPSEMIMTVNVPPQLADGPDTLIPSGHFSAGTFRTRSTRFNRCCSAQLLRANYRKETLYSAFQMHETQGPVCSYQKQPSQAAVTDAF